MKNSMRWVVISALLALILALPYLPAPEQEAPAEEATTPAKLAGPCEEASMILDERGLTLPAEFEQRCPGDTNAYDGLGPARGVTCYQLSPCPRSGYVAIRDDVVRGPFPKLLLDLAHERCHARMAVGLEPGEWTDEPTAEACAQRYLRSE